MILEIVRFGHPVLRQKGTRIQEFTPELERLREDMLETMYAAAGVGLAAQQVGRALQLTVLDVRGVKDRPSTLEWNGGPVEVTAFMPLTLINPEIKPFGDPVTGPEGCLSFPEIYEEITRPSGVEVSALNERMERVKFKASGLLARAIQHEVDHLNGVLFIDRMAAKEKAELRSEIDDLHTLTKRSLARKK